MNGNLTVIATSIAIIGTLSGVVLGWIARSNDNRRETKQEAKSEMSLKMDVEYIKRGIDDVRFEVRSQKQQLDSMNERLTRVEESSKQAHKRIDETNRRLDEKGG